MIPDPFLGSVWKAAGAGEPEATAAEFVDLMAECWHKNPLRQSPPPA